MSMYMMRYSAAAMSMRATKAALTFGTMMKIAARIVTMVPWSMRMPDWTPALLRFCSSGGSRPVSAAASTPLDGPATHVTTEARAPAAMSADTTAVAQPMSQWSKYSPNASMMPFVSPSSFLGTATAIAMVGRMKTSRMRPAARNTERG